MDIDVSPKAFNGVYDGRGSKVEEFASNMVVTACMDLKEDLGSAPPLL